MPKPKKFKAGPLAQKAVRELVQSMTPENRKAFHEGLRVAHRERLEDVICQAFEAGQNGCEFSVD